MNVKKIVQFSVGPIGATLLGFISILLVTRLFSQGDIGRLAMFHIATNICTLLFSLGLDQAYVREYHETLNKAALLKGTLLPGLLLLTASISLLELVVSLPISELLFSFRSVALEALVVVGLITNFLSRFLLLALRMQERALSYSISQLLSKFLSLVIVFSYILFDTDKTFLNLLLAHVSSSLAVTMLVAWHCLHEDMYTIKQPIDKHKLLGMLKYGCPLVVGSLAYWGLTASDKVFLRAFSDYTQLGLYSIAVSIAAGAALLGTVFSTVWAPTVYKWAANNENFQKIDQVAEYMLSAVVLFFSLGGITSGLITEILPDNYASVRYVLIPCLSFPLMYVLSEATVVGLGISKKTILIMGASVSALLFNLLGNYILIPKYGAAGAAIATSFSFWFFLFLRTEFSCQVWRSFPRTKLYIFSFTCVTLASLSALLGETMGHWLQGMWFGFMLICIVSFFQNYKNTVLWISNLVT
ncbi:MAG: lipopolysaccharide biosynthesis protein [Leptolyngbyaceae cyanobacterium]